VFYALWVLDWRVVHFQTTSSMHCRHINLSSLAVATAWNPRSEVTMELDIGEK
jgi:hypothetical protein